MRVMENDHFANFMLSAQYLYVVIIYFLKKTPSINLPLSAIL
jgi:hypothetical protein